MREPNALRWLRRLGLVFFAALVGVPLYVMAATSVQPLADVNDPFQWLPDRLTVRPYVDIWTSVPLARYLLTSLVVAVATTALALLVAVPAGYSLARGRFAGRRPFLMLLMVVLAAPALLFLVPLFVVYAEIGDRFGIELIGTYQGLVITHLTLALPFAIWLLATHLATVPPDLEDAARLDGAGTLRLLWHVVVPVSAPSVAVTGVLVFVLSWGEVLIASVLTRDGLRTVPVGLHGYATQSGVLWNQLTAAALVSSLPVLIGVLVVRRHLGRAVGATGT
jgi:multiple sugar transport system permease protein